MDEYHEKWGRLAFHRTTGEELFYESGVMVYKSGPVEYVGEWRWDEVAQAVETKYADEQDFYSERHLSKLYLQWVEKLIVD